MGGVLLYTVLRITRVFIVSASKTSVEKNMDIIIKNTLERTLSQNVTKQLMDLLVGNTLEDMKYEFFCLRELTELYICVIKHIDMCQKLGEKKANNHYDGCCWSSGVFSDPNFFVGLNGCICSTFDANMSYIETRIKDYNMYRNKECSWDI